MTNYKLWVDDQRDPKEWVENYAFGEWIWARDYIKAVEAILDLGFPTHIAFDHDLGMLSPSGLDLAKWIVAYDQDMDVITPDFTFDCHSSNPDGRENIISYMSSYLKTKRGG